MLVVIGVLHNHMPEVAGTLGLSFVAAIQAAIFTKVEGVACSTVMITGNMRQWIETMFAVVTGGAPAGTMRRSVVFFALCAVFGTGAAVGAFATKYVPQFALVIPVAALLAVWLRFRISRPEAAR